MTTTAEQRPVIDQFHITKGLDIAAPMGIVFDSMLEELGPAGQMPDGSPYPLKLEAWPGGRWFRDLGENVGHLWGHVQVIKPPKLLEICGPLMMSYAAVNHLQYRLTEQDGKTHLEFHHRAVGMISPEHRDGISEGWQFWLERIQKAAERKQR